MEVTRKTSPLKNKFITDGEKKINYNSYTLETFSFTRKLKVTELKQR